MSLSMIFVRIALLSSTVLAVLYLILAMTVTDACYTSPCLTLTTSQLIPSTIAFNPLRVDMSESVSAVVNAAVMAVSPMIALYLIYLRLNSFTGGLVCGSFALVSLISWLQSIQWFDQGHKIYSITQDQLLLYSAMNDIDINIALANRSFAMSLLCAICAVLNSIVFLLIWINKHEYNYYHNQNVNRSVDEYEIMPLSNR